MSMSEVYADTSIEELEALEAEVALQRQQLGEQHKVVRAALDRKYAVVAAREKLMALPEAERAALVQLIAAEGIPSAEAHGTPGARAG